MAKRCSLEHGDLLNHVDTTTTARDLDLLRQAVGDEQLHYYGISYGTLVGAMYANLFPKNVRCGLLYQNIVCYHHRFEVFTSNSYYSDSSGNKILNM